VADNRRVTSQERVMRALWSVMREQRKKLGPTATQEEIAHRAHISVRHLQKIEAGVATPRLDTLLDISAALKTNLQTLLDRAEHIAGRKA
jgi:transcriptional regulator with XRE-family HTH domain